VDDEDQPVLRPVGEYELLSDLDRPRAWTLLVHGTPQSYVDLDDPQYLEFEYVRRLGHVLDLAAAPGEPLRVLHLGAGALTLARYVASTRPGSSQLAVDSDAVLIDLIRARLPLHQPARRGAGRAGRTRIRVADARAALADLAPASFDVVISDVFAGAGTPAHLTSAEFTAAAARVLDPAGVFAVNIGDGPPLAHTRARIAAVRTVFGEACLMADAQVLRGRRFGNLVLAAAARPLPIAGLTRRVAADPFPARLVEGSELDRFVAGAKPATDAHPVAAPVPPPEVFVS
jgi:SAM-dependent methyltransferase